MMNKFTNPLDNIKIASPCSADWNEMIGDSRKRFCGQCNLNVFNLSAMSRTEAEELIINSEGRLCVRMYQRQDGTVITQDCPVGWQAVKRRLSRASAAIASLIIGVFASLGLTAAVSQASVGKKLRFLPVLSTPTPTPEHLMGGVAPQPTPKKKPKPQPSPSPRAVMGDIATPPPTPKNTPKPNDEKILMGKPAFIRD